jgi:hypothetical protein
MWVPLAVLLILIVTILGVDAVSRLAMVEAISRVSFSDVPRHSTTVASGAREEYLVLPYYAMDTRWWVLHTERMLRTGQWRVRSSALDNAPMGREVHWSSLPMWFLAGVAGLEAAIAGGRPAERVAEASLIAGPVMLGFCLAIFVGLVGRRYGWFVGFFGAGVLLTSFPLLRTFLTGETDHHGLVVVFGISGLFALVAGGCGVVRQERIPVQPVSFPTEAQARRWFGMAGFLGAAALWISAATAIPLVVASAAGGVGVALWMRRGRDGAVPCASLWICWGKWGALASLGFYALEYFPGHLGWRLEVNHPLYAGAWFGGGYVLAHLVEALRTGRWMPTGQGGAVKLAGALILAGAPVIAILGWPQRVFWVSDAFLLSLHKEYILEFQSLGTVNRIAGGGLSWTTLYAWPLAAIGTSAVLVGKRALGGATLAALLFLGPAALLAQTMAVLQVRWASLAFGVWALVIVVLVADLTLRPRDGVLRRWFFRGMVVWLGVAIFLGVLPQVGIRAEEERTCLQAPLGREIAGNLLLRDVAIRLIQSSPNRLPVVLTGPNASTEMTYHAGLKTLGTLYWENLPGLREAARIFSVPDEKQALEEITRAGVTHIVIPSWDDFASSYAGLLARAEGGESDAPFFRQIVEGDACPRWLRQFAYPIPTGSGLDTQSVKIFAVLPDQSEFESLLFRGIYFFESNRLPEARGFFVQAAELRPADPRPKQYLAEIDRRGSGKL